MTDDESDGLDDSEFQTEHEKYLQDIEKRTQILHEVEERRLLVTFPHHPLDPFTFHLSSANPYLCVVEANVVLRTFEMRLITQ